MQIRSLALGLLGCLLFLAACQGPPPPTQPIIVITRIIEVVVTATPADFESRIVAVSLTPAEVEAQVADATATALPTGTPTDSPQPDDPFPDVVKGAIYVAEQRFEQGWMFWLQPVGQIWVLSVNADNERIWAIYSDTFVEGEVEIDPEIVPPEEMFQPVRGFGKLWRENPEVREALGWALDNELGHTTRYEYHAGGSVNEDNGYEPGPGHHLVESLSGDTFQFNEDKSTWQIVE